LSVFVHAGSESSPWSRNGALTADENNSPPIPLLHPRDISATETYPAEHIDLEDVAPILVGGFGRKAWAHNSEVVDENVHHWKELEAAPSVAAVVARSPANPSTFASGTAFRTCCNADLTVLSERPFHDHTCAFRNKLAGNRETDALVEPEIEALFINKL